jgi:hypothetical protein
MATTIAHKRAAVVAEALEFARRQGDLVDQVAGLGILGPDDRTLQMCLAELLRDNGWVCTPPAEQPPQPAVRRKKARG